MIYVIGVIYRDNTIVGYRFWAHGEVVDIPCIQLASFLSRVSSANMKMCNFEIDDSGQDIKFTQGARKAYGVLDSKTTLVRGNAVLVVLYTITDESGNKLGYGVIDTYGRLVNVKTRKLIDLTGKYNIANAELYTQQSGELGVRSKKGYFPEVPLTQAKEKKVIHSLSQSKEEVEQIKKENEQYNISIKSTGSANALPRLEVHSFDLTLDPVVNNRAAAQYLVIKSNLDLVSPFYATLLAAIPQIPTYAIPTAAVSEKDMIYNPKFLSSMTKGKATFVLLHEINHIAMQHCARIGNRNAELWNIATDLYINETLKETFGLSKGCAEKTLEGGGVIGYPDNLVCLDGCDLSLDLDKDTPESIYLELLKENPQMGGQGGQSGNSSSQSSNQQGGTQGSQQGQQGDQSQNQSGQQGNQSQSQSGQQSQDSQGSQAQGGSNAPQVTSEDKIFQRGSYGHPGAGQGGSGAGGTGSGSSLDQDAQDVDNSGALNNSEERVVIFRGKRIKVNSPNDLASGYGSSQEDRAKSLADAQNQVERMQTKKAMKEQQMGKSMSLVGSEASLQREMEFRQSLKYNWKTVLHQLAKRTPVKTYTLASPNRKLMNQGMTLASHKKVGTELKLSNAKFCVDVSGSVSDEELGVIYTKLSEVLLQCDTDAELIYWDTEITSLGTVRDKRSLAQVQAKGGGGTVVDCVFEYLSGSEKVNGQKCKTRPRDISAILIFTDGYFGISDETVQKYGRNLGARTIWVVNDGCAPFKPPFGRLASRD